MGSGQWSPLFSDSSEITIVPTYILNNTFRNETGIDVSIEVDLDAISFDAPFLPDPLGPLINPDPFNISLGRINLHDEKWEIELANVPGAPITIPKLNVDQVFNVGDLRLLSRELVDGTEGTGDATYVLNFNRDVVGGPPREYQATVAGVGSILITPSGDGTRESGLFEANQDVVLIDLDTGQQYNLGRDFCLYGCSLQLPAPGLAFSAEDPNNPGQFLPPLYVPTLPDIPDTSVDVPNHPILGQFDTSNVNDVVIEEFGTEVIDLRTGPETTILAQSIDFAPEGDAKLGILNQGNPSINNSGRTTVHSLLVPFAPDPLYTSPPALYLVDEVGKEKLVRAGDPAPGGGTIEIGELPFLYVNDVNESGAIAFQSNAGSNFGVFRAGTDGTTEIVLHGDPLPDGNGYFYFRDSPGPIRPNDAQQVAFVGEWSNTPFVDPNFGGGHSIFRSDGDTLIEIIREGNTVLGLNGTVEFISQPSLNNSGQIAFDVFTSVEDQGVFVSDGNTLTPIALKGDPAPQNSWFENPGGAVLNNIGQVAFVSAVELNPGSDDFRVGIYRSDGTQIIQIARTGDSAPAQDGDFYRLFYFPQLNEAGQVLFAGDVRGPGTAYEALFIGQDSELTEVARGGQPAPDGNGAFSESEGPFYNAALNNKGHVAFSVDLQNTAGGTSDSHGIYLYDGTNIVQVARTGQPLAGSTVVQLSFADGQNARGLNDEMQIAYYANLADGREVIARFEPSLYWRNPGSGAWGTAGNWSLGIAPTNPYDVQIIAENALTVAGPALNSTVKSLSIGGDETASATLHLTSGVTLTATNGTTIRANGILSGAGTIAGDVSNLGGTVSPGASPGVMQVDGNFVQNSLGLLMLEIGGPLGGTDYDVLDVSGDVLLDGDVVLAFLSGYVPPRGTQFNLLRFDGSFDAAQATFRVVGAPAGLQYSVFADNGVFGLMIAVPEPSNMLLLLVALSACTFREGRAARY